MEQGWFYAKDESSVGPISVDVLTGALLRMPEPGQTLVWRAGFEDWRPAKDIPELAGRLLKRAPVVTTPDPGIDRWSAGDERLQPSWIDDGLPAATTRRWPAIAAVAVAAAIVAAGVIYALAPMSGEPVSRVALPAASTPEAPKKEVAKQDPAVVLSQLTETAAQAAAATDALAQKLWAAIEPPAMQAPNYATASRGELENYLRELQTAEANVPGAQSQYVALLKAERDLIEETTQSSGLEANSRAELLSQVDDRQRVSLELANSMLQARIELYRAMQGMQTIAIEQFGKYKASADGMIRFSSKAAGDRFGAAGEEVSAVNKRLDLIEDKIMKARQTPKPGWKDMVIK